LLSNTNCLQIFHGNIHRLNQNRRVQTREQFMDKINPANYYKTVTVPTLFVSALDDSIFQGSTLKKGIPKVLDNPNHAMVILRTGEHMCFYENFWYPTRWCERLVIEYFREYLSMEDDLTRPAS
jgi:predicted alpha/beta-fold hydrolase